MSTNGVHFLAFDKAKARLAETEEEYKAASQQLDEALKMGDLRENAEYDVAKDAVARIARMRDELSPVVTMPVVRSNDNVSIIEEGSVVHLIVHSITPTPVKPGSDEFEAAKNGAAEFEGVLMFGATLNIHELLVDNALAADTPIGRFLVGRQPGDYSVPVPAGYANITATKLSSKTTVGDLYCKM